jgi:hypothetical protein
MHTYRRIDIKYLEKEGDKIKYYRKADGTTDRRIPSCTDNDLWYAILNLFGFRYYTPAGDEVSVIAKEMLFSLIKTADFPYKSKIIVRAIKSDRGRWVRITKEMEINYPNLFFVINDPILIHDMDYLFQSGVTLPNRDAGRTYSIPGQYEDEKKRVNRITKNNASGMTELENKVKDLTLELSKQKLDSENAINTEKAKWGPELKALKFEIKTLEEEKKRLQENADNLSDAIAKLKDDIRGYTDVIAANKIATKKLNDELKEMQLNLEESKEKIVAEKKIREESISKVENELRLQQQKYKELMDETDKIIDGSKDYNQIIQDKESKIEELKRKIESLDEERTRMNVEHRQKDGENAEKIKDLEDKLAYQISAIRELKQEHDKQISVLRKEIEKLKDENDGIKEQYKEIETNNEEMLVIIGEFDKTEGDFKAKIAELEDLLRDAIEENKTIRDQKDMEIKNVIDKRDKLVIENRDKDQTIQRLMDQIQYIEKDDGNRSLETYMRVVDPLQYTSESQHLLLHHWKSLGSRYTRKPHSKPFVAFCDGIMQHPNRDYGHAVRFKIVMQRSPLFNLMNNRMVPFDEKLYDQIEKGGMLTRFIGREEGKDIVLRSCMSIWTKDTRLEPRNMLLIVDKNDVTTEDILIGEKGTIVISVPELGFSKKIIYDTAQHTKSGPRSKIVLFQERLKSDIEYNPAEFCVIVKLICASEKNRTYILETLSVIVTRHPEDE